MKPVDFLAQLRKESIPKEFPEIEAIMVGGSVGRGDIDDFSDIDLFLLISKHSDFSNFLNLRVRDFSESLGEVFLFRGPTYVQGFGYSFTVLYQSQLVCQFNVNNQDSLTPNPMNNQDSIMIYDQTGYYSSFLKSSAPLAIDELGIFTTSFTFFWLRALSAKKEVNRNNLWLAMRHLSDMRDQMIILKRLQNKCVPPGINYQIPSKSIEKQLDKAFNKELHNTLCTHSYASVLKTVNYCVQWYLQEVISYITLNKDVDNKYAQIASTVAKRFDV